MTTTEAGRRQPVSSGRTERGLAQETYVRVFGGDVNERLVRWIHQRAVRDFPQDLALVLHYGSSATGTAGPMSDVDCCFVPATDAGLRFARTFVIDGVGYDIFPVSWQRLERIADLREPLEPLVGDSVVLHAAKGQDREKLDDLRRRLRENLAEPGLRHDRAAADLGAAAVKLGSVAGSTDGGRIRTAAGLAGMDLAHAVALANGTYFHHGPKGMLRDLNAMPQVPESFVPSLIALLTATDPDEATVQCVRLLHATAAFLEVTAPPIVRSDPASVGDGPPRTPEVDPQALACLYEEICSSFVKVREHCASGDSVQAAIDALLLQRTLDEDVPREVGLPRLVEAEGPTDVDRLMRRTDTIDTALLHAITQAGGQVEHYPDLDAFLRAHP